MNTEQTSENIFTHIKMHYGEVILAKIQKLEKTMIKYSSYTDPLRFSIHCHHNKILLKDIQLKSRIKTEQSKQFYSSLKLFHKSNDKLKKNSAFFIVNHEKVMEFQIR